MVVTFTGNTTDEGVKMMADTATNAFVSLSFDSGSMNWACTDASTTTSNVSELCGVPGTGLAQGTELKTTDLIGIISTVDAYE